MLKLKIDNKIIEAEPGKRLIEVARDNGIHIPSLCFDRNLPHYTSCMVCMVKELRSGNFIPSCSVFVTEGMEIDASGSDTISIREKALGMLLTEHRAECEAPCSLVCPLGLDIPLLNRHLTGNRAIEASELVFKEMGLPFSACLVCPGYCENACRRKMIDRSISIPALVQFTSGENNNGNLTIPAKQAKKVAIAGGGASGLITAFNLVLEGHSVDLFEKESFAGGSLLNEFEKKDVPVDYLNREIDSVLGTGIKIKYGIDVDDKFISSCLAGSYDTMVLTFSPLPPIVLNAPVAGSLKIEGDIRQIEGKQIFLTGNAAKENQPVIRKMGQAKLIAAGISRYLNSGIIDQDKKRFNSTLGKIDDQEKGEWLRECPEKSTRIARPSSMAESTMEAENCLHCDCRAASECRLRDLCNSMGLKNPQAKMTGQPISKKIDYQNGVIFEHAKCIKCGLCVRVTEYKTNDPSLCFTGRGFMTMISEPVAYGFNEITGKEIDKAIYICPTGALTWKE